MGNKSSTSCRDGKEDDIRNIFEGLWDCMQNEKLDGAKLLVKKLNKEERTAVSRLRNSNGWTLLFDASYHGQTAFVQFLLDKCCADIEQRCDYGLLKGYDNFEEVTPLCCAAVEGKIETVKTLVQHGADINAESSTQTTPVLAACFANKIDVVTFLVKNGADVNQPDKNKRTCLMFSVSNVELCHLLLQSNALVDKVDEYGNSALYHAVLGGYFYSVKMLMEYGADPSITNNDGYDAMASALHNITDMKGGPRVAVPVAAENNTDGHVDVNHTHHVLSPMPNFLEIFEYLVREMKLTPSVRCADAYSLLAAMITVDKNRSAEEALHFWFESAKIRMDEKFIADPSAASVPIEAYNFAGEVADTDSLANIAEDAGAMNMQALVVLERILGLHHPETIRVLEYCALEYCKLGAYQRCVDILIYTLRNIWLDLTQPENCRGCRYGYIRALGIIIWAFSNLSYQNPPSIRFVDICAVLLWIVEHGAEMMSSSAVFLMDQAVLHRIVIVVLHLLCSLTMTEVEASYFKQLVRSLVKTRLCTLKGETLLHIAVSTCSFELSLGENTITYNFPSIAVLECLLSAGAAVNDVDLDGNTPLHIAVNQLDSPSEMSTKEETHGTIELLLNYGAHHDIANAKREVACDKFPRNIDGFKHVTLQCLAARAVKRHQLPYRGIVPGTVANFVDVH